MRRCPAWLPGATSFLSSSPGGRGSFVQQPSRLARPSGWRRTLLLLLAIVAAARPAAVLGLRGAAAAARRGREPQGDVCTREIWGGTETRQLLLRSAAVAARGAIDWQPASVTVSFASPKSESTPRIGERYGLLPCGCLTTYSCVFPVFSWRLPVLCCLNDRIRVLEFVFAYPIPCGICL